MMVTLDISAQAQRAIRSATRAAGRGGAVMEEAVLAAAQTGADVISEAVVTGQVGIATEHQHPASGLGASVQAWWLDRSVPMAAVGVPSNSPAARYAAILERGGTIYPKNARALAVPISAEAKKYSSPRDMEGLTLIPRKGKPPLLVRQLASRGQLKGFELHWVLVPSVTIAARHWLTRGARLAAGEMGDAARDVVKQWVQSWRG